MSLHLLYTIEKFSSKYPIIIRRDYVVLGGTHDVDDWSTDISEQTKKRILSGCTKLIPSLQVSHGNKCG